MKTIILSTFTMQRLAATATLPWVNTATQRVDGRFDVPVSDETFEILERRRAYPGESDEDVVQRMLGMLKGSDA